MVDVCKQQCNNRKSENAKIKWKITTNQKTQLQIIKRNSKTEKLPTNQKIEQQNKTWTKNQKKTATKTKQIRRHNNKTKIITTNQNTTN